MATSIDRSGLISLIESERAQVVDVLPAVEYDVSHIPAAINIPLKNMTEESVSILSRDHPVVVYCHDGL
jgi:phage shock protein E